MRYQVICGVFVAALMSLSVQAHKFSTAYLEVREQEGQPALLWKVSLHDLAQASIINTTNMHQVSWQQVLDSEPGLVDYIRQRLIFTAAGERCQLESKATDWLTQRLHKDLFLLLPITVSCNNNEKWQLNYQALFDIKHSHKAMLSWQTSKTQKNAVLAAESTTFSDTISN